MSKDRRNLYPFKNIIVFDNINLSLQQGDKYEVIIETGRNLIPAITTRIVNNTLTIRNESTCPLLKDPWNPIEIRITFPEIDSLVIRSQGRVWMPDTIFGNRFYVSVRESSADIQLLFDVNFLQVGNMDGTADVTIKGKARDGYFYHAGYGKFDALDFFTTYTIVNSNSTNDCYVRGGTILLDAKIMGIGNIYFVGQPENVKKSIVGSGEIIKLD